MRHLVHYWKLRTVDNEIADEDELGHGFDHDAGSNLSTVAPGDTIWVVTIREGGLALVGRLIVGDCVTYETAKRRLKRSNLWKARYHVLARSETIAPAAEIAITKLASELRFVSKSNDRLTLCDGKVSGMQLQTLRELTLDSAYLLKEVWDSRVLTTRSTRTRPRVARRLA